MDKIKYTKMTIIIRPEKINALKDLLEEKGVRGMTITAVRGNGQQLASIQYEDDDGVQKAMLIPKTKVEIMYKGIDTIQLVDEICKCVRTNIMGDGKIFIEEIEGKIMRVRTGEINEEAL